MITLISFSFFLINYYVNENVETNLLTNKLHRRSHCYLNPILFCAATAIVGVCPLNGRLAKIPYFLGGGSGGMGGGKDGSRILMKNRNEKKRKYSHHKRVLKFLRGS